MGNHETSNSQNLELNTRARGLEDLTQDILWLNEVFQKFPKKDFVFKVFPKSIEEIFYQNIKISLYKVYRDDHLELLKDLNFYEFYELFERVTKEALIHNSKKEKEEEEECSICMEKKIEINLKCGHCFCEQCITNWMKKDTTCPMCRETCEETFSSWVIAKPLSDDEIGEDILNFIYEKFL